jgi:hypothetical protein
MAGWDIGVMAGEGKPTAIYGHPLFSRSFSVVVGGQW